ncbi:MAG: histidine phosphatase family protein [Bacteroidota bacterium]
MKSKTIYILRHGQTNYNKKGMVQGRGINASLNEKGVEQARLAGRALHHINFDHVFISELVRTKETVDQIISDSTPLTSLAGFDEISWGNQEGKVASYEAKNQYAATVNGWRKGELNLNVGGGETPIEVMERQKEAMEIVLQTEAETVLICMHGRAMRVLLCWLLNYPLKYMDGFPHDNCSYYSLDFHEDTFYLKNFNKSDHLN